MSELTQAKLKELLHYDPETGVFTWRKRVHSMVDAGDVAGSVSKYGYRCVQILKKVYKAHRLAWLYTHGDWPAGFIDHINGIRDDNRIENLRVAKTEVEQAQNQALHENNTSGFPGVHWRNDIQKWSARIGYRRKRYHLGYFDAPEEAAEAYRKAKLRLHKFCPEVRDFSYEQARVC